MDSELQERIDHSMLHESAVREVAALLPTTDEALGAVIAETIATGHQMGFLLITTAALHVGRRVSAEHLTGGAALAGDPNRLGNFAWKMEGDIPGALMAALKDSVLPREIHAGTLFIIAAWCAERRGGELPADFAAEARRLARTAGLKPEALVYLAAAALTAKDEGFVAVLRQKFPVVLAKEMEPKTMAVARESLALFAAPVMDLVPDERPRTLAHGRTMRRSVEKLGRNERCHCASGRKYKHCCFEKDQERLHFSTEVAGKTHAELRAEPEAGLTESRIKAMPRFELSRLDPRKVPEALQRAYIIQITGLLLLERAAEYFEVLEWNDERRDEWNFAMVFVVRQQRKEIALRMVAARARHEPVEDLSCGTRLLLARDDSSAELSMLGETAASIVRETDVDKLVTLGMEVLSSHHAELGILICRSLIPLLPRRQATFLLGQILEARDKLNLPPDDPFGEVLEKRADEETSDDGIDAAALRAARQRLEAKAAEVCELAETVERQRRKLEQQEKKHQAAPPSVPQAAVADAELREMRIKLDHLKATLHERSGERIALRRELEKTRDDLEALRQGLPAPAPSGDRAGDDEATLYLPEQPAGNQPIRLVEFPHKFRETLDRLPRPAASAALALIGRLAGGEPAAFAGVVQLKACHRVLRQRIGSEHRLLFRLHPDRVQVLDLINRRDLDRRIKTLLAAA